jgi:hypothetical protein
MKTIELTVYEFSELSEKAKEKVVQEFINDQITFDHFFAELDESINRFEELFGVKVTYEYRYGSMNARFDLRCIYLENCDPEDLTGLRLHKWIWNNWKNLLYKGKYYFKTKIVDGKYQSKHRHSNITLDNSCVLTGTVYDHWILDPIYDFLNSPTNKDLTDVMNDCMIELQKRTKASIEYMESEEYVQEMSEDNDWQYLEDGTFSTY